MPHIPSAIAEDRIARLHRRIAEASYAVDRRILAEALAAIDDLLVSTAQPTCARLPIRAAAVAMLQTALAALTDRAVMILQLHFVELLCADETAAVMTMAEPDVSAERRLALCRLHRIIAI